MRIKRINLVVMLAVFLSGCFRSKKATSPQEVAKQRKSDSGFVQEGGTYVFNDDADEFRLDEDDLDPFDGEKGGDQDDFQWDNIVYDTDAGEVIQFDFDDTAIKPSEKTKIKHNAELAKQELDTNPKSKVTVKGHACKIAKSELYNRAISQERAENVAKAYAEQGIPRDKMSAVGYGAAEPLTDEEGREAQSVNRRVETDFVLE